MTLIVAPAGPLEAVPEPVRAVARSLHFRAVDYLAVLSYTVAFVLNIVTAQMDAELSYGTSRDPAAFSGPQVPAFQARVDRWHALNGVKSAVLLLGWITVRLPWCLEQGLTTEGFDQKRATACP